MTDDQLLDLPALASTTAGSVGSTIEGAAPAPARSASGAVVGDSLDHPSGPLRRGGPILSRARLSLAIKMVFATVLTLCLLLSLTDVYLGLGLAVLFILVTVALDYWVYRAVDSLFRRLVRENRDAAQSAAGEGADDLHGNLEELTARLMGTLSGKESFEIETVRSDLYRLRSFNNQLIRLGEIAQELNAALPYRETKQPRRSTCRSNCSRPTSWCWWPRRAASSPSRGVVGCEEGEINTECCGFYAKCPVRGSFRDRTAHDDRQSRVPHVPAAPCAPSCRSPSRSTGRSPCPSWPRPPSPVPSTTSAPWSRTRLSGTCRPRSLRPRSTTASAAKS